MGTWQVTAGGNPPGTIVAYAGSTAPTGWLIADGSAVSRTTYAALFAVISTKYGVGDGSTTFNVPNLKGKVPVGLDATITDFNDRGKSGGHRLLQSHTHITPTGVKSSANPGDRYYIPSDIFVSYVGLSSISDSTGGGDGENMPPYVIVNYIIKT